MVQTDVEVAGHGDVLRPVVGTIISRADLDEIVRTGGRVLDVKVSLGRDGAAVERLDRARLVTAVPCAQHVTDPKENNTNTKQKTTNTT